jgi:hypothetical protein
MYRETHLDMRDMHGARCYGHGARQHRRGHVALLAGAATSAADMCGVRLVLGAVASAICGA